MRLPARLKGLLASIGIGARLPGGPANWGPSWLASAGVDPRRSERDPTPAQSLGSGSVYSAVSYLSGILASIAPRIVEALPQGGQRIVRSTDSARCLADWAYTDREGFLLDALTVGNGYCKIIRNDRGAPAGLRWLPAWRVGVYIGDDGGWWYEVQKDAAVGEPEEVVQPRDMLHLKFRMLGRHRYLGVSPLVTAAPSLGLVVSVRRVGGALYRNFASPVVYVTHPKVLEETAMKRVKERWLELYSGEGVGEPAILAEGMTPGVLDTRTALDAQLAEMSKVTVADVSRIYQVPLTLLSETSTTNYATSAEEARSFARYALGPWAVRIGDCLTRALLEREVRLAGLSAQLDLQPITRGHGQELAETVSKLVNAGLASPNEIREWLQLPDVEHGGELRAPSNTYPLSNWIDFTPPAPVEAAPAAERAAPSGTPEVAWLARELSGEPPALRSGPLQEILRVH